MAEVGETDPQNYTPDELESLCRPVFTRLYEQLAARYPGWIIVIEPKSEEYFLGLNDCEVLMRARKKHPRAQFFAYKLNENPAADSLC